MIQENLKVLRLKKGMSQEELAVRIHVVRQTVSKWEKGLSVPDAQTLIQIAQALEVPVSAFLGETIQAEKEEDTLQIMAKKPPSGPNVIGGADGATGILIVGTNRFAFGVGMAVCICALIAGGILLHRSKR